MIASLMLAGLPQTFDSLLMAVQNSTKHLKIDEIKTLLSQEPRLNVTNTSGDVFFLEKSKKKQAKQFSCHSCDQLGRFARNCPSDGQQKKDVSNATF